MKCAILFHNGVPEVVIVAPDADGVAMSVIEARNDTEAVICVFEMESVPRPDGGIALMDKAGAEVKMYTLKNPDAAPTKKEVLN